MHFPGANMSDITGLIYAGIIVAGGVLGYVKSGHFNNLNYLAELLDYLKSFLIISDFFLGSTASLTAGLVCGGAAGVAAAFDNNPMLLGKFHSDLII